MIRQSLCIGGIGLLILCDAHAMIIDSDKYVRNLVLNENTTLAAGNIIDAERININRSLYLTNNGDIYGDIYICEYCEVYIQNRGTYNGTIHTENGATVTRIITSRDDLSELNINGDINILLKDANDISLADILNLHENIAKITLDNSHLVLNETLQDTNEPQFELIGNVTLQPDTGPNTGPLLSNVVGDGTVIPDTPNDDPMHGNQMQIDNGNIYLEPVRETDYQKLFDGNLGDFLNGVRESAPDNKLISALDKAATMPEIHRIMSKSIRLNPELTMNPIRVFNKFARANYGIKSHNIGISPEYITSDNFYIRSVTVNAGLDVSDHLYIGVAGYTGEMDYSDFINDYAGNLYGGNASAIYNGDYFIMRATAGTTIARFDTPTIFYKNQTHKNPTGRALYGNADTGIPFHFGNEIRITPFIGADAEQTSIMNIHHHDITPHIGTEIVYSRAPVDIQYDYTIHIVTDTDGTLSANFGASWFSIYDNIGGGFNISILKDDIATSYKLGLNLHMRF